MTKTNEELIEEFHNQFPSRNPDVEPKITDYLRSLLTQKDAEIQKAREELLSITANAIEENAAFYEQKYGGNYEQCGRDIKFSIAQALDHSELDQPNQ